MEYIAIIVMRSRQRTHIFLNFKKKYVKFYPSSLKPLSENTNV